MPVKAPVIAFLSLSNIKTCIMVFCTSITICLNIDLKSNKSSIGTKSYLDTVAAAVVSKDMELIEQYSYRKKKLEIATFYLNNLPYKTLPGENYIFHRFIILPEKNEKQSLLKKLNSQKILAKGVYEPNCINLTQAQQLYEKAIELPCHAYIDIEDLKSRIEKVI